MAQEMAMPGVFGGLMRYNDEYNSKLKISPVGVMVLVVIVIMIAVGLRMFFPLV
jgi:preprotein translocase subunit Sec61beta